MKKILTAIFACSIAYSFAQITISKDLSYGNNGVVTLGSYVTSETDYIKPMDNGEVLLSVYNPGGAKFIKLKTDGTYNPAFGTNGILTVTDDRILSIHNNYFYGGREFEGRYYIKRYLLTSGSLDTSFGVNGVLDAGLMYQATMITQPDGKILVRSQNGFKRYSSAGILDTSFANNGFYDVHNAYGTHSLKLSGNSLYEYGSEWATDYGIYKRNIALANTDTSYGVNGKSLPGCPSGNMGYGYPQYLDTEGEVVFLHENSISKKLSDGNSDISFANNGCLDLQTSFSGQTFKYNQIFHYKNQRFYFILKNESNPTDGSVKFVIYNKNGNLMTINNQSFYETNLIDDQYGYIGTTVVGNYLYMIGFSKVSRYILSETSLGVEGANNQKTELDFVNPFKNELNLYTNEKIKSVEIYDEGGRLVLKNNSTKNINTSMLEKGVYFIKIITEQNQIISKKGIKN